MYPHEIHIDDFRRILAGEVPWAFLLEVVLRGFFIYFLLVFSMRLMGKRMAVGLNRNELAALVSLAAAVGVPMQEPGRGLLPALIIALIVVGIQRGIAVWSAKNKRVENVSQGDISIMVQDGCLRLKEMEETGYSKERIFAQVRSYGIYNLGQVQRLYLETKGGFSILTYKDQRPGLSVIPTWDSGFRTVAEKTNQLACSNCGFVDNKETKACTRCGEKGKDEAIR